MPVEYPVRKQLAELSPIIDLLTAEVDVGREAFVKQCCLFFDQSISRQESISLEISLAIRMMSGLVADRSDSTEDSYHQRHAILTHLQKIAETTACLEKTLQKKVQDCVLFSAKSVSQVSHLFYQQLEILCYLGYVIRTGGEGIRLRAIGECKSLDQSCMLFATEHETRLVEGLCLHQASPIFLAILEQMQTLTHNELAIANLLGNEI
jgi:Na+/phosphate symporter